MKASPARVAGLIGAVALLVATAIPSASATTTVKTITFGGTVHLDSGLGYPCMGATGLDVEQCPGSGWGSHARFVFISDYCVKDSAGVNQTPDKSGVALCTLYASGALWGHCGLANAAGTATLVNLGPLVPGLPGSPKAMTSVDFTFHVVGGLLVLTGTETGGNAALTAEALAVPAPTLPGSSCSTRTVSTFIVAGEATLVDPTP